MLLQEIPWLVFKDIQVYPVTISGSEVEMEGPSHPVIDGMAEMRRQFQMLQAQGKIICPDVAGVSDTRDTGPYRKRGCNTRMN